MRNTRIKLSVAALMATTVLLAGCSKKIAKVTPPPPPPAPAPTATLAANPQVIHRGESAILTWQTQNADSITIDGLGSVNPSGTHTVSPNGSTTYTLIAKGPGGTRDATARVTVNVAVSQAPAAGPSESDLFARHVKDIFFDYDKANIRSGESSVAAGDAAFLAQHPSMRVLIEGHCDDRGSDEYNIALGQSRAESLKQDLQRSGVDASRIQTVSYGKEHPFCTADDDACWQQNRRDHIALQQ